MLATNLKGARVQDSLDIKKIKSEADKSKCQHLGTTENISLGVFGNASLANLPDGGSQGENIVFLFGEKGKAFPLSWQSRKIG